MGLGKKGASDKKLSLAASSAASTPFTYSSRNALNALPDRQMMGGGSETAPQLPSRVPPWVSRGGIVLEEMDLPSNLAGLEGLWLCRKPPRWPASARLTPATSGDRSMPGLARVLRDVCQLLAHFGHFPRGFA